jgi:nitrogen fixation protein NifU and related proteins
LNDFDRSAQLEFIMDHYQNPRNHGEMPDADVHLEGGLPGCSDLITMYLKFDGDRIQDISFVGVGCTISQASASALTEQVKGMSIAEVNQLNHESISDMLGEEVVQTRPRCATLSLDTLRAAIAEHRRVQIQGK